MNDSEEQGFYEVEIETFTQNDRENEGDCHKQKQACFKIRPALSVHSQISLYQYPDQLDNLNKINQQERSIPSEMGPLDLIAKRDEDPIPLADFFPRNLQCIYNKFREKICFKRDLTRKRQKIQSSYEMQPVRLVMSREEPVEPLTFSSNFQCGNLHLVFKERKLDTYYLLLQNDVNTHGFNFWFYFNVRSTLHRKYSFVIVNFSRIVGLEREVSIVTYSHHRKKFERKLGFVTAPSRFCRCDNDQTYWSLLFQYQFEENSDVYFSLTLPYSYSKVIRYVKELSSFNCKSTYVGVEAGLKSPLGNVIPVLKISKDKFCKKIIFIATRQHPCETVGSFVCQSIIKQLCSKNQLSQALLQRFRFLIIPMVNVDGVIHGNSRTNIMGYDLNRSWDRSGLLQSVECQQIWKYLQGINTQNQIKWSFDLHGHSREHGFFAYFSQQNDRSLIMSHFLSSKSSIFRAKKCIFEIGVSKRESMRAQLYQRMKVENAITIETSLFGYYDQNEKFVHFQSFHFDQIAQVLLESLLKTEKMCEKKILKNKNIQEIIKKMEKKRQEKNNEIDSDPDPEGDYLKKWERKEVEQLVQCKQLHMNEPKLQNFHQYKPTIERKRVKTDISQPQKLPSDRASPIRVHQIHPKLERTICKEMRLKNQRNELFNLTFTNRSRSYHTNSMRSQEITNKIKYANNCFGQRERENNRLTEKKPESDILESEQSLKKSLDMRKKIKFAFENRLKTQRGEHASNLIDASKTNKIRVIIYPAVGEKEREKLQIQNTLKSKRQLTKQLRNQSYGTNISSRFHNSFYLKSKNL